MSYSTLLRAALGAGFILCVQIAPAQAQNFQSFVSVNGSNANNCDGADAPCRTLEAAINVTNPGGKVFVLDSGDFNGVSTTIDKSISIVAVGADATLFTGSLTKITVDAGPDDVVYLDGLLLRRDVPNSGGTNDGIRFVAGKALHVRNCTIRGFGRAGIFVQTQGPSEITISDCTIVDNENGVWVRHFGSSGNIRVLLDRVTIARNVQSGVRAVGPRAFVRVDASTITNNGTGVQSVNGGKLLTYGSNVLIANGTDGAFTGTQALK